MISIPTTLVAYFRKLGPKVDIYFSANKSAVVHCHGCETMEAPLSDIKMDIIDSRLEVLVKAHGKCGRPNLHDVITKHTRAMADRSKDYKGVVTWPGTVNLHRMVEDILDELKKEKLI